MHNYFAAFHCIASLAARIVIASTIIASSGCFRLFPFSPMGGTSSGAFPYTKDMVFKSKNYISSLALATSRARLSDHWLTLELIEPGDYPPYLVCSISGISLNGPLKSSCQAATEPKSTTLDSVPVLISTDSPSKLCRDKGSPEAILQVDNSTYEPRQLWIVNVCGESTSMARDLPLPPRNKKMSDITPICF